VGSRNASMKRFVSSAYFTRDVETRTRPQSHRRDASLRCPEPTNQEVAGSSPAGPAICLSISNLGNRPHASERLVRSCYFSSISQTLTSSLGPIMECGARLTLKGLGVQCLAWVQR
jgi:hypothetical protein